ncbi:hypothetical protein GCM10028824_31230 [Hymenobacter segetis]
MYGNVLAWYGHAGTPLLKIKLINTLVGEVTTAVAGLDAQAALQLAPTTGVTRTRTEVKKEAAEKAEVLRGLVLVLTSDDVLAAALAKTVGSYLYSPDTAFLAYAQKIAEAVGTIQAEDLADAGYQPEVLDILAKDLKALADTDGQAVLLQAGTKAVTDGLPPLFAGIDATLLRLDKLVNAQRFAYAGLVTQYEALRRLPKTPATHQFRAKGLTPYNEPQLVFNILDESVPTPNLYNTGGRGHDVVFYLGATPTSRPRPGQGVLVKNGKKVALSDYSTLGTAATEPYLLVLQTSELAAGGWRVRG